MSVLEAVTKVVRGTIVGTGDPRQILPVVKRDPLTAGATLA